MGYDFKILKNGNNTEYPLINVFNNQNKVWLTWISNNPSINERELLQLLITLEGYCSIYNESGQFLGNIRIK